MFMFFLLRKFLLLFRTVIANHNKTKIQKCVNNHMNWFKDKSNQVYVVTNDVANDRIRIPYKFVQTTNPVAKLTTVIHIAEYLLVVRV